MNKPEVPGMIWLGSPFPSPRGEWVPSLIAGMTPASGLSLLSPSSNCGLFSSSFSRASSVAARLIHSNARSKLSTLHPVICASLWSMPVHLWGWSLPCNWICEWSFSVSYQPIKPLFLASFWRDPDFPFPWTRLLVPSLLDSPFQQWGLCCHARRMITFQRKRRQLLGPVYGWQILEWHLLPPEMPLTWIF